MRDPNVRRSISILLLVALVAVSGCTSYRAAREAETAAKMGNWDDAVLHYLAALEEDPNNVEYRAALLRAKIQSSREHFEKGQEFEKAGVIERALVEYQQAVQLDPTNQYAMARLEQARQAYNAQRQGRGATSLEQLKESTRASRPQPPELNPRSKDPIDVNFPEPTSIFEIYRALGQAFGINVMFDPNLKDQEIAIELKQVTAQAALETLIRTAGHFYKVMDDHTVIIAQDTPQNRRVYEDLVIQTFFLSNAEVKDMMTILRSLIDARKIATNEQLNAIILRDTADKVKVAERIIEANDKSKAEVVVDVELLQIDSARLRNLGVSLTEYSVGQSLDTGVGTGTGGTGGGTGGGSLTTPIRLSDIEFLNQSNWILTIPNFIYNFVKRSTQAQILARPQLRITDGEKANLIIGDKVPIPLTTFNTQNVGTQGGIVPITSFQYQDVGIRIDLEPRVHHNQEVTLKIKVEVSNLSGTVEGSGGQEQPIIGTRTIESVIRLQDGETNFLAGLIRTADVDSDSGFPGLSEIPVLGRLFSSKSTDRQRTDVILTLTPHIIRNAQITEEDLLPIWVGTEANVSFRGGSPRVESDVEGPFDGNEGTPEEIQDAIRRRIQRLPRGLRPGEGGMPDDIIQEEEPAPQPPPPPTGVELVPATPPTDIFRPPAPAPTEEPPVDEEPPAGADLARLQPTAAEAGMALASQKSTATQAGEARARGAAVRLWLAPQRLEVAPGDRFEMRVQVAAGQPISHLPLSLDFDARMLAVEKVEAGDFLGGEGEAQVMSDFSRPGSLVVGASRMGQVPGVKGDGTVARITFRALAKGSTRIGFVTGKALDASLKPVASSLRPARVEIGEIEPDAEALESEQETDQPASPAASRPRTAALLPREASPAAGR
ncbi:MAG TPA: secretin N-terminal domain-containing protein [Thermoanaerobaculia bacterium]|nr:secretin N-terminal domain-containing protein [Thermoanaerobaculia bacterium]